MKHSNNVIWPGLFNDDEKEVANTLLQLQKLTPNLELRSGSKRRRSYRHVPVHNTGGRPIKVEIDGQESSSMVDEDRLQEPPPSLEQKDRLVKIEADPSSPEAATVCVEI
jgi:hypothetical protein